MNIEIYFDKIKSNFNPQDIKFSLNFTKITPMKRISSNLKNSNNSDVNNTVTDANSDDFNDHFMVKYLWKGALKLHEVIVVEVKFPMLFDTCGNINVNIFVVALGSIFVIFLVGMLFYIFSAMFFEEV